jgi:hypothetical protein
MNRYTIQFRYPSVDPSIHPSIHQYTNTPIHQYTNTSIHPSTPRIDMQLRRVQCSGGPSHVSTRRVQHRIGETSPSYFVSDYMFNRHDCRNTLSSRVSAKNSEVDDMSVSGLPSYCDDFVCTSSPAVELTVKALARDIERANGVWTTSLLSKNVEYKDAYCSTRGIDAFKADFIPSFFKPTNVKVTKMYMVDAAPSQRACIEYTIDGILNSKKDESTNMNSGGTAVTVDMKTTVTMNLLTGQIECREDSWNVRSLLSKAPWNAARLGWAGIQRGREVRKKGSELIDKSVSSVLGSLDDDEMDAYQADPRDPMKFFQQNDSFKDDATTLIIFLLVLYIVVQGYSVLFGGGSGGGGFGSSGF